MASALLGVVVGGVVGYVVQWLERKRELRSVMQALLWELEDAKPRLDLPTAIFETPIPSVDTLLTRGLLCSLPDKVRGPVLAARSLVQVHDRQVEQYDRDRRGYDQATNKYVVETLTGLGQNALAAVNLAIDAVRPYLGRHAVSRKFPITPPGSPGSAKP